MAQWTMMSDFAITLPDRPGELARLASRLREADVNLLGLWGYGSGAAEARFYCVPESAEQFRNFAESAELAVEEGTTFFLQGTDSGGALVARLDAIAHAGINLRAIEAIRVGGAFGAFLWADSADWPRLAEVLTAV
jgi:prephenate dehydratase